jgi:hypothetical protein
MSPLLYKMKEIILKYVSLPKTVASSSNNVQFVFLWKWLYTYKKEQISLQNKVMQIFD